MKNEISIKTALETLSKGNSVWHRCSNEPDFPYFLHKICPINKDIVYDEANSNFKKKEKPCWVEGNIDTDGEFFAENGEKENKGLDELFDKLEGFEDEMDAVNEKFKKLFREISKEAQEKIDKITKIANDIA